ncbi:MAG TPA: FhaA domain-containing protein [Egibacteraceae bacterium]
MGILRDFEQRLEGAVEGFFARAFRSGLQPVELAKAVQRYAGNYQQIGVDGVFVPNVYRFDLSPEDMERFSGFAESLQRELADVVSRTAAERGWKLQGPVRIEFRTRDDIPVGTYELRGKAEAPPARPRPASAPRPHATPQRPRTAPSRAAATTVLPAGGRTASLRIVEGPGAGRRHRVKPSTLIGRLPECDVTLDDPSVSRRHARLVSEQGRWRIEDLGSTNGVRVNGEAVDERTLHDGDHLELGSVHLVFSLDG